MLKIMDDVIRRAVVVQGDKMYNDLMRDKARKKGDKVTAEWYTAKIGAQLQELLFLEQLAEKCGALNNYYSEMRAGEIRFYSFYIGMVEDEVMRKIWQNRIDEYYKKSVA